MKFKTCALVVQLLTQSSVAMKLNQHQHQHQKNANGGKDPIDNVYIAGSKETWNPKLQIFSLLQEGAKNAEKENSQIKNQLAIDEASKQKITNANGQEEEDLIVSNFMQTHQTETIMPPMPNTAPPNATFNHHCRNYWGLNPLERGNPNCEDNAKLIDYEASSVLSKPKDGEKDDKKAAKSDGSKVAKEDAKATAKDTKEDGTKADKKDATKADAKDEKTDSKKEKKAVANDDEKKADSKEDKKSTAKDGNKADGAKEVKKSDVKDEKNADSKEDKAEIARNKDQKEAKTQSKKEADAASAKTGKKDKKSDAAANDENLVQKKQK